MAALWYGMNAPFIGGNERVLSRQVDEKLIRNDLLQLLLTAPGERVMRLDFGAGLRNFLFQPITQDQIDTLRDNIVRAIETYERRVVVTDVQITTTPDNNLVTVKIYGYFNFNRINNSISPSAAAELLVELGEPTSKSKNVPVGG
jgi:phage baseplate assembly protein W